MAAPYPSADLLRFKLRSRRPRQPLHLEKTDAPPPANARSGTRPKAGGEASLERLEPGALHPDPRAHPLPCCTLIHYQEAMQQQSCAAVCDPTGFLPVISWPINIIPDPRPSILAIPIDAVSGDPIEAGPADGYISADLCSPPASAAWVLWEQDLEVAWGVFQELSNKGCLPATGFEDFEVCGALGLSLRSRPRMALFCCLCGAMGLSSRCLPAHGIVLLLVRQRPPMRQPTCDEPPELPGHTVWWPR
eukprot:360803-Chlamydomonas_euryale.AAC.1